MKARRHLEFHPLTPDRWPDFQRLFGPSGACGGCWCMWWRLTRPDFARMRGDGNRLALRKIVRKGSIPGLMAYLDGEPAGWCALAPREHYPRLANSRVLARVDDRPVWSITCFFVPRRFRGKGMTVPLLRAAVDFARLSGARIVEGYPVEPHEGKMADVFLYTGLASSFRKAGFKEVVRRSATRPLMRRTLTAARSSPK